MVDPRGIKENDPVVPRSGIDDSHRILLVLEAGIGAIEREDLSECLRFLSGKYQDAWGYNPKLISAFVKRAFKEFSQPRIELQESPTVQVNNQQALAQVALRLKAFCQGRSNYLLGDSNGFNKLALSLEKEALGWKLVRVQGLKPLGFDERFLKLIGSEIGLPLNEAEQKERRQACMPCREKMSERFGADQRKKSRHG